MSDLDIYFPQVQTGIGLTHPSSIAVQLTSVTKSAW